MRLGLTARKWREWTTVVLRKPSKPKYDVAKAYRPIALYPVDEKILTGLVAEDLTYMSEKFLLLPSNHFGGRPGHATTDALHFLTHRIKEAWSRNNVVVLLSLDIEGAFPHAMTDRLLHNMRKRKVPEEYIQFFGHLLKDRRTKLRFDDYLSDWINIENGIGQGDPASMVLYLFYNADLLEIIETDDQIAVAFVDDVSLAIEARTISEGNRQARHLMQKPGGGYEWSRDHNS
jgi:hypothetical protein